MSQFFAGQAGVSAVLLTCSCARGKATPDSCLDIAILAQAEKRPSLERAWQDFCARDESIMAQSRVGAFSQVDLDFHDDQLDPRQHHHGWTSGPDEFELEVGNLLAYSHPLWEGDGAYRRLKSEWLPYYAEGLRQERLEMVLHYCRNNLAHIPLYVCRGLYFQAFRRMYNALGEFLQALFIARRTYPIAYDKWVHEQVVEILGLPELYPRLVGLLEVRKLESNELVGKADEIERLIQEYIEKLE